MTYQEKKKKLLYFLYDLKILKEFNFSVSHHLCSANNDFDLHEIKKITSHPQVFGQCNNWIRNNLPDVEVT